MNLFDIVKRGAGVFNAELVVSTNEHGRQGKERCIRFSGESSLQVTNANEITCLECFPREPGWEVVLREPGSALLTVSIKLKSSGALIELARIYLQDAHVPANVHLNWPLAAADAHGYDLIISTKSTGNIFLNVGPTWSARKYLLSQIAGFGVEVGPGTNPGVLPSDIVNVRYVENIGASEWREKYGSENDINKMKSLWDRYIISSAENLEKIEDESLDFIFSSHVFEHLVNPLAVLENWSRKLRSGGAIVGIIPDCRFSFDCRQPPSTLGEISEEYKKGGFSLDETHYSKWIKYTAPRKNISQLMEKKYSVHAKYYLPTTFRTVLKKSSETTGWKNISIHTSLNAKDFGFYANKI